MTVRKRLCVATTGFTLPVLALLSEMATRLPFPSFALPAVLTPVLFLGPFVIFGVAIFATSEWNFLSRLGVFLAASGLFVVQILVLGFILLVFTGLEGTQ